MGKISKEKKTKTSKIKKTNVFKKNKGKTKTEATQHHGLVLDTGLGQHVLKNPLIIASMSSKSGLKNTDTVLELSGKSVDESSTHNKTEVNRDIDYKKNKKSICKPKSLTKSVPTKKLLSCFLMKGPLQQSKSISPKIECPKTENLATKSSKKEVLATKIPKKKNFATPELIKKENNSPILEKTPKEKKVLELKNINDSEEEKESEKKINKNSQKLKNKKGVKNSQKSKKRKSNHFDTKNESKLNTFGHLFDSSSEDSENQNKKSICKPKGLTKSVPTKKLLSCFLMKGPLQQSKSISPKIECPKTENLATKSSKKEVLATKIPKKKNFATPELIKKENNSPILEKTPKEKKVLELKNINDSEEEKESEKKINKNSQKLKNKKGVKNSQKSKKRKSNHFDTKNESKLNTFGHLFDSSSEASENQGLVTSGREFKEQMVEICRVRGIGDLKTSRDNPEKNNRLRHANEETEIRERRALERKRSEMGEEVKLSGKSVESSTHNKTEVNREIDYKKLYEEQRLENSKLLLLFEEQSLENSKLRRKLHTIGETSRDNPEKNNRLRHANEETEIRERRALERKRSEMGEEVKESSREKRKFKSVIRDDKIQESRLKLPILSEEDTVMEAINENLVTIVVGSTGSGKTTQVPQFLYEAGYTKNKKLIGVTEPRRVAAIEMSERVGHELGLTTLVSYQVRFAGNSTRQTEIKFMTDGVLLKEILQDRSLTKYSVIIIDEAHERSLHSDILIGLLSRIVLDREKMKDPLKLVIMSATLRNEDFTENKSLFGENIPPVVNIEGRNFKVEKRYNRETDEDYCEAAYRKVCQINQKTDNGAILVFLTGQVEIEKLCIKLRKAFPMDNKKKLIKTNEISKKRKKNWTESNVNKKYKKEDEIKEKFNNRNYRKGRSRYFNVRRNNESKSVLFSSDDENDVSHVKNVRQDPRKSQYHVQHIFDRHNSLSLVPIPNQQKEDVSDVELSEYDSNQENLFTDSEREHETPLWVLPLYSALERLKQKSVFKKPPEGTRLCVVATNVAETSLTIPNIKYVVDCGKVKEKVYDQITGVSSFKIDWTSKASADQRAGRAGRTCDGFCYRLYSPAVFNDEFAQYSTPDIEKRPLDEVVLLLKKLEFPVYKFPYPTPPIPSNIDRSIKRLVVLGALEYETDANSQQARNATSREDNLKITTLGNILSRFPVSPRFAKILYLAAKYDIFNRWNEPILEYVIIIVAVLSVKQLLLDTAYDDNVKSKWEQHRVRWSSGNASNILGDILVMLNAVIEAESTNAHVSFAWCRERGIGYPALMEVKQLRFQLTKEIQKLSMNELKDDMPQLYFKLRITPRLPEPSPAQCKAIAEMMIFGSLDQVAKKLDLSEIITMNDQGYLISQLEDSYRISNSEKLCYIDKSSIFHKHKANYPQWLIYQDIYEPRETSYQRNDRVYLKEISVISKEWRLKYGGKLVELGPPLDKILEEAT